jgi:hypothetical protein
MRHHELLVPVFAVCRSVRSSYSVDSTNCCFFTPTRSSTLRTVYPIRIYLVTYSSYMRLINSSFEILFYTTHLEANDSAVEAELTDNDNSKSSTITYFSYEIPNKISSSAIRSIRHTVIHVIHRL